MNAASRPSLPAAGEVHLWWLSRSQRDTPARRELLESLRLAADGLAFRHGVSHSADVTVIAVTTDDTPGIDLERIEDFPELQTVAEMHFAPRVAAALGRRCAHDRARAFAVQWTRLEARLKWAGTGFSAVAVPVAPNLRSFVVGDFVCSIATSSPLRALRCFTSAGASPLGHRRAVRITEIDGEWQ